MIFIILSTCHICWEKFHWKPLFGGIFWVCCGPTTVVYDGGCNGSVSPYWTGYGAEGDGQVFMGGGWFTGTPGECIYEPAGGIFWSSLLSISLTKSYRYLNYRSEESIILWRSSPQGINLHECLCHRHSSLAYWPLCMFLFLCLQLFEKRKKNKWSKILYNRFTKES